MKRLLTVAAAAMLAWPASVRAEGPDDKYIQIYKLIQEGDQMAASGRPAPALDLYIEARTELKRLQTNYPAWNAKLLEFRLRTIESKLAPLEGAAPTAAKPAPGAPSPGTSTAPGTGSPVTPAQGASKPSAEAPPRTPAQPQAPMPAPTNAPVAPPTNAPTPVPGRTQAEVDERDNQIRTLQEQLGQLQNDRTVLQAKLREAVAAQPAVLDPRELAKAEERIKAIEKEKDVLRVSLQTAEAKANNNGNADLKKALADTQQRLAQQNDLIVALRQEKELLQKDVQKRSQFAVKPEDEALKNLRAENDGLKRQLSENAQLAAPVKIQDKPDKELASTKAALQSSRDAVASLQVRVRTLQEERDRLDKTRKDLETRVAAVGPANSSEAAQVRKLQKERDDLQKKLNDANHQLADNKADNKKNSKRDKRGHVSSSGSGGDVSALRARLQVLEASKVPYTSEELALFKKPQEPMALTQLVSATVPTKESPEKAAPLLAEAQRAMSARRFDEAEKKYLEVLQFDGKNVSTLQRLAAVQLEQSRPKDAEANLKGALEQNPSEPRTLLLMGIAKFDQEKFDDALTDFSRSAQLDPQNPETQNYLGITLSQKGQRAAAETALRKAVQLSPNYKEAHYNLAVVYATQQPPFAELARWHYQKALAYGHAQNPELEKLLDQKQAASSQK